CPPGSTTTATFPFGLAQLMLRAARSTGVPTALVMLAPTGRSRENTGALEQPRAPRALSRFCVTVLASAGIVSPPARIRFFIARQSRDGSCAFRRAATPVTCGVAIDVPLKKL